MKYTDLIGLEVVYFCSRHEFHTEIRTVLLRAKGTPQFLHLHFGCFDHLSERMLTQMLSRLKSLI